MPKHGYKICLLKRRKLCQNKRRNNCLLNVAKTRPKHDYKICLLKAAKIMPK